MPQHYLSEFTDSKRVKVKCLQKKNWTNIICPLEKILCGILFSYRFIYGTTLIVCSLFFLYAMKNSNDIKILDETNEEHLDHVKKLNKLDTRIKQIESQRLQLVL